MEKCLLPEAYMECLGIISKVTLSQKRENMRILFGEPVYINTCMNSLLNMLNE